MFELPDAKRVRREELYGSDSASDHGSRASSGPGEEDEDAKAEARARLNARLSSLVALDLNLDLDLDSTTTHEAKGQQRQQQEHVSSEEKEEEGKEEEFEFRLFSSSKGPAAKVVLPPSDEDEQLRAANGPEGDGGILAARPISCYLRGDLSAEEKARIRAAAISGREVIRAARARAWGLEVPWRVTKITVSSVPMSVSVSVAQQQQQQYARGTGTEGADGTDAGATAVVASGAHGDLSVISEMPPAQRKRPGKKRRIAFRLKEKAAKEKEAAEAKQRMTKEEHLKEKKKRLNREKKLKRRKKDKEKKMPLGGGDGDGDNNSAAEEGGDAESP